MCFGKNVSVQFSEEQLEPLEVNCVSKRFCPSVALMSDCGPVKFLTQVMAFLSVENLLKCNIHSQVLPGPI